MSTRVEQGKFCVLKCALPHHPSIIPGNILLVTAIGGEYCTAERWMVASAIKKIPLTHLEVLEVGHKLCLTEGYKNHPVGEECRIVNLADDGAVTVQFQDNSAEECVIHQPGFAASAYTPVSPVPPVPPLATPPLPSLDAIHVTPQENELVCNFLDGLVNCYEKYAHEGAATKQEKTNGSITELLQGCTKQLAKIPDGQLNRTKTEHASVEGGVNAVLLALSKELGDKFLRTDGASEYPAYCSSAKALIGHLVQNAERLSNITLEEAGNNTMTLITAGNKFQLNLSQYPDVDIFRTEDPAKPDVQNEDHKIPREQQTKAMFASQPSWEAIWTFKVYIHIPVANRDDANVFNFTAQILRPQLAKDAKYIVKQKKKGQEEKTTFNLAMTLCDTSSPDSGNLKMAEIKPLDGLFEDKCLNGRTNASGNNVAEVVHALMISMLKKVINWTKDKKDVPDALKNAMAPLTNVDLNSPVPSDFKFDATRHYSAHKTLTDTSESPDSSPPPSGAPETKLLLDKLNDQFGPEMRAGFKEYLMMKGESQPFLDLMDRRASMLAEGKSQEFLEQKRHFEDLLANFKAQEDPDFKKIQEEFSKLKELETHPRDLILEALEAHAAKVLALYREYYAWQEQQASNATLKEYLLKHVFGQMKCAQIQGVASQPQLNGKFCVCTEFSKGTARWTVRLGDYTKSLSLKPENLSFEDAKEGWKGRLLDTEQLKNAETFSAKIRELEALNHILTMQDMLFSSGDVSEAWTAAANEARGKIQTCISDQEMPCSPLIGLYRKFPKLLPAESPLWFFKWDSLLEPLEFDTLIAERKKAQQEEADRKAEAAAAAQAQQAARAQQEEADRKRKEREKKGDDHEIDSEPNSKKPKGDTKEPPQLLAAEQAVQDAEGRVLEVNKQIESKEKELETANAAKEFGKSASLCQDLVMLQQQLTAAEKEFGGAKEALSLARQAAETAVQAAKDTDDTKGESEEHVDEESDPKRRKTQDAKVTELEGQLEALRKELENERKQKRESARKAREAEEAFTTIRKTLDDVLGKTMRCMKNAINALPDTYYGDGVEAIRRCNPLFAQRVHDSIEANPLDKKKPDKEKEESP